MKLEQSFKDTPINAIQFLKNKEGEIYKKIVNKNAFYVLQLSTCNKAIKIGRSLKSSGGIIVRLNEYLVQYSTYKILCIVTFGESLDHVPNERKKASMFEQLVIKNLFNIDIVPIRGKEYYKNNEETKEKIENVIEDLLKKQIRETRPTLRRSKRILI